MAETERSFLVREPHLKDITNDYGASRNTKNPRILYVTDLDGTFLSPSIDVSRRSAEIMNELVGRGVMFTIATARSYSSLCKVTPNLIKKYPLITYNGASIVDPNSGEMLYSQGFSREESAVIEHAIRQHGIAPLVYSMIDGEEKLSWIEELENDGILFYLSFRRGDKRLRKLSIREEAQLYDGETFYFTCIGPEEQMRPLYETLKDDLRFNTIFHKDIYCDSYWCEVMPRSATKGNAVLHLKKMLDCDRVVCFGDAINDLSMFEIADEAYAVENAVEALKRIATAVIPSHAEDGVARWMLEKSEPK